MSKTFFAGLDMLNPELTEPTKMPRTAGIPVVRDWQTGYVNAGTYSCGVASLKPLQVLFGPKGPQAIAAFRRADEFVVAVPSAEQIDHMWVTALEVPHGISEIDVAGWHELPSKQVQTPGIEECPLNLECRKIFCKALPPPWRDIVIGEVVGVSIDTKLLGLTRSQVGNLYPMNEAGSHPETGVYGPSVLSGEMIPQAEPVPSGIQLGSDAKTYVSGTDLHNPRNARVLMNAIWPRPAYILLSGRGGEVHALPITGGALQSTEPAVQIAVPKDSPCYDDIRRTGEFAVAIPDRSMIQQFERLEQANNHELSAAGFTLLRPNAIQTPGIAECPVNMDCEVTMLEDVEGTDYAMLVGRRVGVVVNEEIVEALDPELHPLRERLEFINAHYASFMYAVMDASSNGGLVRKWAYQDKNTLSVRPLPSWGNRWTGGWWGPGPSINTWLIELIESGLITKPDYGRIRQWIGLWSDGRLNYFLAKYGDASMKEELRQRLTKLFRKMAWAHRDLDQWREVREYLAGFPEAHRGHHSGPVFHEKWYDRII